MTKSIYKITNRINGKVYIGQSKEPNKRFKQHLNDSKDSIIHLALKKYGIQNFDFKIIEKDIENYNEREKYWINFYHAQDRRFGYNILPGGEEPPIIMGENSSLAIYSEQVVRKIEEDILHSDLIFEQIAEKYGTSTQYISLINNGYIRHNKELIYPLRVCKNLPFTQETINLIIHDLIYTCLATTTIAKKYNIGEVTVYYINKGEKYRVDNIQYPIREDYSRCSTWLLNNLIAEIKNNRYKFSEIERMYGLSKSFVNRINQGKIYRRDNETYPLRSSAQRVY